MLDCFLMNYMRQNRRIIDITTPILTIIKMFSKVLEVKGLTTVDDWSLTKMFLAKVNKYPYLTSQLLLGNRMSFGLPLYIQYGNQIQLYMLYSIIKIYCCPLKLF